MYKGIAVLVAVISLGFGGVAMARGNGDQHGTHSAGGGKHGSHGGAASGHMSEQGRENTNAQWSGSATKGQDRSTIRSDDHQGHSQSHGQHHGKGKGHGKHQ